MVRRRNISNDLRLLLHNPHLFSSDLRNQIWQFQMGDWNCKILKLYFKIFPPLQPSLLWLLPSSLMLNVPLKRKKTKQKQKDLFFKPLFGTWLKHLWNQLQPQILHTWIWIICHYSLQILSGSVRVGWGPLGVFRSGHSATFRVVPEPLLQCCV